MFLSLLSPDSHPSLRTRPYPPPLPGRPTAPPPGSITHTPVHGSLPDDGHTPPETPVRRGTGKWYSGRRCHPWFQSNDGSGCGLRTSKGLDSADPPPSFSYSEAPLLCPCAFVSGAPSRHEHTPLCLFKGGGGEGPKV